MSIRENGQVVSAETAPVAGSAPGVVGPFILTPVAAGDDPDPGMSTPQLAGYGGLGVPWQARRAGSLRSLVVMLTNPADGSDLIVAVFSDDPGTPLLSVTIVGDGTHDKGHVEAIEGAVPIAADQSLALAVWTGSGWTRITDSLVAYFEVQPS